MTSLSVWSCPLVFQKLYYHSQWHDPTSLFWIPSLCCCSPRLYPQLRPWPELQTVYPTDCHHLQDCLAGITYLKHPKLNSYIYPPKADSPLDSYLRWWKFHSSMVSNLKIHSEFLSYSQTASLTRQHILFTLKIYPEYEPFSLVPLQKS